MLRVLLGFVVGVVLSSAGWIYYSYANGHFLDDATARIASRLDTLYASAEDSFTRAAHERLLESVDPVYQIPPDFFDYGVMQSRSDLERARTILNCSNDAINAHTRFEFQSAEARAFEQSGDASALIAAAQAENPNAQLDLGIAYAEGLENLGYEEGRLRAIAWITRAADDGHALASMEVGRTHWNGAYTGQSDLTLASDAGNAMAKYYLSRLPPADGVDFEDFIQERHTLELESAVACFGTAAISVAGRLQSGRDGFIHDKELATAILNRIGEAYASERRLGLQ